MNRRITAIGKLYYPAVKFGNDFCNGRLTPEYKAEESGPRKYIYPIFEILN